MIPTLQLGQLGRSIKASGIILPTVTWNNADKSPNISISPNPLVAAKTSGTNATWDGIRGTLGKWMGKHYFEARLDILLAEVSNVFVGIALATPSIAGSWFPGSSATDFGYYLLNGNRYTNGSATAYGAGLVDNDYIGVLLDLNDGTANGTLEFFKNNVSQGVAWSNIPPGTYYPATSLLNFNRFNVTGRFRSADFGGSLPSGASPWGG